MKRIIFVIYILFAYGNLFAETGQWDIPDKTYFYWEVDTLPKFKNVKYNDLYDYIRSEMNYPQEIDAYGTIIVSFVVAKDGSVEDVRIERGLQEEFDKEIERILYGMPKWKAGKKENKDVKTKMLLPVKIFLK